MNNVNQFEKWAENMTKEDFEKYFINTYLNMSDSTNWCPSKFGLENIENCNKNCKNCKECWNNSIKNIKFK